MVHLLWNIFKESGQVSAYLFYRAIEDEEAKAQTKDALNIGEQEAANTSLPQPN
ncbi:MAG: YqzL family protein [Firmicutes bacterium]|nr:YqzL family protein [Bacillota bacterium]